MVILIIIWIATPGADLNSCLSDISKLPINRRLQASMERNPKCLSLLATYLVQFLTKYLTPGTRYLTLAGPGLGPRPGPIGT